MKSGEGGAESESRQHRHRHGDGVKGSGVNEMAKSGFEKANRHAPPRAAPRRVAPRGVARIAPPSRAICENHAHKHRHGARRQSAAAYGVAKMAKMAAASRVGGGGAWRYLFCAAPHRARALARVRHCIGIAASLSAPRSGARHAHLALACARLSALRAPALACATKRAHYATRASASRYRTRTALRISRCSQHRRCLSCMRRALCAYRVSRRAARHALALRRLPARVRWRIVA